MSEPNPVGGEPNPAIVDPSPKPKGMSPEEVQAIIAKAMEEERRKYQSKIDQILAEKKAVESKTMTTEERMAQLEAQLKAERAAAKREKAKALAGFDDELETAILDYGDPDKATDAAQKIKARLESEKKALMEKIEELEKRLQFGSKAPPAGKPGSVPLDKMSFTELMAYAQISPQHEAEVLAYQARKK